MNRSGIDLLKINLKQLVLNQRIRTENNKLIQKRIMESKTLLEKCILAREYLTPQSTIMENIIKQDLKINNKIDELSGDGNKNGINYEIKFTAHDKYSKFNFVQIRPDHNIDYYIFVCYNLYEDELGKEYILKIPSNIIYDLIINYGAYAHGTKCKLGPITKETLFGNNYEYCLRASPNINDKRNIINKSNILWNKLLQYQVEYNENYF